VHEQAAGSKSPPVLLVIMMVASTKQKDLFCESGRRFSHERTEWPHLFFSHITRSFFVPALASRVIALLLCRAVALVATAHVGCNNNNNN